MAFYILKWNARILSLKQIIKELKSYKNTDIISDYAINIPWTERTEWNIQHSYFSLDEYSTDLFLTDDRRKKKWRSHCVTFSHALCTSIMCRVTLLPKKLPWQNTRTDWEYKSVPLCCWLLFLLYSKKARDNCSIFFYKSQSTKTIFWYKNHLYVPKVSAVIRRLDYNL